MCVRERDKINIFKKFIYLHPPSLYIKIEKARETSSLLFHSKSSHLSARLKRYTSQIYPSTYCTLFTSYSCELSFLSLAQAREKLERAKKEMQAQAFTASHLLLLPPFFYDWTSNLLSMLIVYSRMHLRQFAVWGCDSGCGLSSIRRQPCVLLNSGLLSPLS